MVFIQQSSIWLSRPGILCVSAAFSVAVGHVLLDIFRCLLARGTDHSKRRYLFLPAFDVVPGYHIAGAGWTKVDNQQRIGCVHHLREFPPHAFHLDGIKAATKYRVLHPGASSANDLVDLAPPRRIANVVTNQAPALVHRHQRNRNRANTPPSFIHSFSSSRTSSSINRA